MTLESQRHAENAQQKLTMIEEQILRARSRPKTLENRESLASLTRMANQLREEILRFEAKRTRRAS